MFVEDDAEIGRILAKAEEIGHGASQEILGAIGTPTTTEANFRLEDVAPDEGATAFCGMALTVSEWL